jgi:predicted metal-dependent hydrolase
LDSAGGSYRNRVPSSAASSGPSASSASIGAPGRSIPDQQVTDHHVEVRRSARRRRTVSAYRDGDRIVVLVPDRMTRADEQRWVQEMVERIAAKERTKATRGPRRGDEELLRRARELSARHLGGSCVPASVRWVSTMRTRWASCTPADASIRVSSKLREVPVWVLDYVLVHELAHLKVAGHGPEFWALVNEYPRTERARGYLDGFSAGAQFPIEPADATPGTELDAGGC